IVWDVDAKVNPLNLGHGWWIEVWITEDPAPIPYHEALTVTSLPRRGIGLAFRFGGGCPKGDLDPWRSALEQVHVTDDHKFIHDCPVYQNSGPDRCFDVADAKLNHFELRISQSELELWVSDYDDPKSFKLRDKVSNLDLPFSRGYVHFQHAHYNAAKD